MLLHKSWLVCGIRATKPVGLLLPGIFGERPFGAVFRLAMYGDCHMTYVVSDGLFLRIA